MNAPGVNDRRLPIRRGNNSQEGSCLGRPLAPSPATYGEFSEVVSQDEDGLASLSRSLVQRSCEHMVLVPGVTQKITVRI